MISVINDPFHIDVAYRWEESDLQIAATLSFETEQRLLDLARQVRESLMNTPLHGDQDELRKIAMETSFLRGKYEVLLQLVADSKEAKVAAHLI